MAKQCKIDVFSKEELKEIVENSNTQVEVLQKLGYGVSGASYKTLRNRCEKYNIDLSHLLNHDGRSCNNGDVTEKDLCQNSSRTTTTIKRFILKNNIIEYKCAFCGNKGVWNNQELVLQLDHIDGDNTNHSKENLRFLCPNCHTQTKTWGRNKNN